MKFFVTIACLFIGMPVFFSSCYITKNIPYFSDLTDTSKVYSQAIKENYEAHIQPDDILEILVSSMNPQATAIFNLGNTNTVMPSTTTTTPSSPTGPIVTTTNRASAPSGYLVNRDGEIDFPVIGKIYVKGLSTNQLKDTLTRRFDPYLQNPIVNVRLLNYKVTILGEVVRPNSYTLQSERVSVVDAIGLAGDLTIHGRRENVLLIREENGERKFIRLNLNSSTLFESPYFYLKQNDVLYIEPNKTKVAATDTQTVRNISILTSIITLLVVVITRNN